MRSTVQMQTPIMNLKLQHQILQVLLPGMSMGAELTVSH